MGGRSLILIPDELSARRLGFDSRTGRGRTHL